MRNARDLDRLFAPAAQKLARDGAHPAVVESFRNAFARLAAGDTGQVPGRELRPVGMLPALRDIVLYRSKGLAALDRTAVIKLNGGLGTSMGLDRAKSLIPVREGRSFLDIIALQIRRLHQATGTRTPLIFMNSYRTQADTVEAMRPYGEIVSDAPFDFLQHRVPKILVDDLSPAVRPDDPELEWCPPGHGDIYLALSTSGVLGALLDAGYEYAFVSNADNLGAVVEPAILGYIRESGADFLMEVTRRTHADRKGGHIAARSDGRLILRESTQCPPGEMEEFQDVDRYRFFNTNNLWIRLSTVRTLLDVHGGILPLPLILNVKPVDPGDPASPAVYQLESAMGAAISLFPHASALVVARDRFAPVKTTGDLLAVRSDAYALTDEWRVKPAESETGSPVSVSLDANFYRTIGELDAHFPFGPPSLVHCREFVVSGECTFGRGIVARDRVSVSAAEGEHLSIPDGTVLDGAYPQPHD